MTEINFKKTHHFKVADKDLEVENKKLKRILEDIETLIRSYDVNKLSDSQKVLLDSILLIKNGTIKVVREDVSTTN